MLKKMTVIALAILPLSALANNVPYASESYVNDIFAAPVLRLSTSAPVNPPEQYTGMIVYDLVSHDFKGLDENGTWKSMTGAGSASSTVYAWSGFHDTDCSWTQSPGSISDFSDDSTCTFTQVLNSNFGTVTSYGSKKPGVSFTAPVSGIVETCVTLDIQNSGSNQVIQLDLYDGTTSLATTEGYGSGSVYPTRLCGYTNVTASTAYNIRVRGWAPVTGNITINTDTYGKVNWTLKYVK